MSRKLSVWRREIRIQMCEHFFKIFRFCGYTALLVYEIMNTDGVSLNLSIECKKPEHDPVIF